MTSSAGLTTCGPSRHSHAAMWPRGARSLLSHPNSPLSLEGHTMSNPTSRVRLTRRSLFGAAAATLGTAAVVGAAGGIASPGAALAAAPAGFPQDLEKLFRKPGTKTALPGSAGGGRTVSSTRTRSPARSTRSPTPGSGCSRSRTSPHSLRARHRPRGQPGGAPRAGWRRSRPRWPAREEARPAVDMTSARRGRRRSRRSRPTTTPARPGARARPVVASPPADVRRSLPEPVVAPTSAGSPQRAWSTVQAAVPHVR